MFRRLSALSYSHLPAAVAVIAAAALYLLPASLVRHTVTGFVLFLVHAAVLVLTCAPASAGAAARGGRDGGVVGAGAAAQFRAAARGDPIPARGVRADPIRGRAARRWAWILTAGVIVGFTASQGVAHSEARRGLPSFPSRVAALSGTVMEDVAPPTRDFTVRVGSVETERGVYRYRGTVVLEVPEAQHLLRGSRIHAVVVVDGPPGARRLYADASAIATTTSPRAAFRGRLRARITALAECADLELMTPLLIGSRHGLSRETEEAFRRAGSLHLLALSGMHVALLVALVYVLTRHLGPRAVSIVAALLFVLFFLWIAGPRPSLIRAVFLTVATGVMALFRRKTPLINLLALAFIFMALVLPVSTQRISFHLSFLALLGILLAAPALDWLLDGWLPGVVRKPLAAGIGAQFATAPVVAAAFGVLYPIGAVAGVVLAPVVTLFLWGAVGAVVVDLMGFSGAAEALLALLSALESFIRLLVAAAGHVPGVRPGSTAGWVATAAFFAAVWLVIGDAARRRRAGRVIVTETMQRLRGIPDGA